MRRIRQHQRFRKDLKKVKARGKDGQKLSDAVYALARLGQVPITLRPHRLGGAWADFWECHLEPDWLLVYSVSDTEVILVRTGTHADLFE
ncbi:type II toxin-antitoxin system YafQ family toxin [Patescibacteria group bacterium]|nr:type II toxin-antitoxin system YafQ family toxin [Patescibacteria group bacterium]